jgi:hypothetical protein
VDYRGEEGIGFHSVVIIDLVVSICYIVDVDLSSVFIIVPFDVRCRMSMVIFMVPKE